MRYDDQTLIYLLMNDTQVSLPQSIFISLWKYISESRNRIKSYIPYGRVLSEIFFQEVMVDFIKEMIAEDGPENCPKRYLLKTKREIFSG